MLPQLFGRADVQVLHPFYVFQIASIALWSIDDYYYYAFAIAVISISSILGTLIETKRTIERMREMSRYHCDVNVLVDGECEWSPHRALGQESSHMLTFRGQARL